jgi:tetratricopeptide (TPR) repeat protein
LNATLKIVNEFNLGRKLSALLLECEKVVNLATTLKHIWPLISQRAIIYFIQGLTDTDYNEALNLLVQEQRNAGVPLATSFLNYMTGWRLILSYIMCDYDHALMEARAIQHLDQRPYPEIDLCMIITVDSLVRLELCPSKGWQRRKTLSIVRKRTTILQKFSNANPQLCLGMLHLVRAKVAQTMNNISEAMQYYGSSFSLMDKEKLSSIYPIACEEAARLMMCCKKEDDQNAARQYFEQSLQLYSEWGAQQKCLLLQREVETLFKKSL